jgi:hypothetical protein
MQKGRNLLGLLLVAIVSSSGCGPDEGRVRVYPVSGTVLVNDQPAEGARVVFYSTTPADSGQKLPTPSGMTDSSGEFRLDSYEVEDGAPAGDYQVTVVWPEPPPPNATGIYDQKDRLRGRYADRKTSKITARVESGGGEIPPFDLK